jgi:diacylglycerol kinase family enzyme
MTPFKHVLVLRNPRSTHIRFAERQTEEIAAQLPDAQCIMLEIGSTVPETYERLRAYKNILGPDTLLCVAGGDGTVNRVTAFLLGDEALPKTARSTAILPLWAGNANDLAHMANGPALRMRLIPTVFAAGKVVPVYPLVCTLAGNNGHTRIYHAACYASFGVSGASAHRFNLTDHRRQWWRRLPGSRFVGEVITVVRTFLTSDGFTLKENGGTSSLHERSYVNGTRMGKLYPFAANLTDQNFVQISIDKRDKHIFAVWHWLAGGMRPKPQHQPSRADSVFTTQDDIWMQVDGEPVKVRKGTRVSVRCSPEPLYVLSTRLARGKRRSRSTP